MDASDRKYSPADEALIIRIEDRISELETEQKAEKQETKQQAKRQLRYNFSLMIFTGLLFITSVVANLMTYWQARIAGRSADAATSAALTAEAALRDAQRSFLVENRPYVTVEMARLLYRPEAGRRLEASVVTRNFGKTPAVAAMPDISIEGRTSPLPTVVTRLGSKSRLNLGANQGATIPVPGSAPLRADSIARLEKGEVTVYVYGFVDYMDVFGCKYTTEFCGFYDPATDSENPLVLVACSDHNERIEHKCEPSDR
jgi:hypothetical protein